MSDNLDLFSVEELRTLVRRQRKAMKDAHDLLSGKSAGRSTEPRPTLAKGALELVLITPEQMIGTIVWNLIGSAPKVATQLYLGGFEANGRPPKILLRFGDEGVAVGTWTDDHGGMWVDAASLQPLNLYFIIPPTHWAWINRL